MYFDRVFTLPIELRSNVYDAKSKQTKRSNICRKCCSFEDDVDILSNNSMIKNDVKFICRERGTKESSESPVKIQNPNSMIFSII